MQNRREFLKFLKAIGITPFAWQLLFLSSKPIPAKPKVSPLRLKGNIRGKHYDMIIEDDFSIDMWTKHRKALLAASFDLAGFKNRKDSICKSIP